MIWTATKIDDATFCIKNFWYLYLRDPKYAVQVTGPMARGIFLHHHSGKSFYKKNERGILVPKFRSAEAYSNAAKTRWNHIVSRGTIQGKQIKWQSREEPWIIREEIKKICKNTYEKYSIEEPPLFIEALFDFYFDGRHYRGRIDEIRKNITLRDKKFSHRVPGEMKLAYNPQFTLYALAFMSLCYADRKFAEICNVPGEEVEKWAGNPNILSEKVNLEYCLIRDKGIEIFPATRNNNHYYDFCNMLDGLEEQIREGRFFVERGRNCDYCKSKEICDAETAGTNVPLTKEKQLYLFQDAPGLATEKPHKQLRIKFPRIKNKSFYS